MMLTALERQAVCAARRLNGKLVVLGGDGPLGRLARGGEPDAVEPDEVELLRAFRDPTSRRHAMAAVRLGVPVGRARGVRDALDALRGRRSE